jgi:hypothetical protein
MESPVSDHSIIGRFYVEVGSRWMAGRFGSGVTDPTIRLRSLTSDVIIGDMDSRIITASLAAHVKDHGKIRNLTLTSEDISTHGDWRITREWTAESFILEHGNAARQRERLIDIFDIDTQEEAAA